MIQLWKAEGAAEVGVALGFHAVWERCKCGARVLFIHRLPFRHVVGQRFIQFPAPLTRASPPSSSGGFSCPSASRVERSRSRTPRHPTATRAHAVRPSRAARPRAGNSNDDARDAARDKIRSRTYFYWPVMTYISALNLTGFWGRFVFPGRLRGSLLVPSSAVLPAVAPAAPGGGRFCA